MECFQGTFFNAYCAIVKLLPPVFSKVACIMRVSAVCVQSIQFLMSFVISYFANICQMLETTPSLAGRNLSAECVQTHIQSEHVGAVQTQTDCRPSNSHRYEEGHTHGESQFVNQSCNKVV